jgi:hypothetical protein
MASFSSHSTIPSDQSKKRRAEDILTLSDDDETTFPRFLVATATDGQPITLSIFGIQQLLKCAVGDIKSAKKLRNGSVLIEVRTKLQADTALSLTNWVNQPVTVTAHRSLNTCRGVIRCREFRDCEETEVHNALSAQGAISVKQIMAKRNGQLEKTNTFIVTFGLPTLPKSVRAAYMKLDVEPYIPNPLRCFNCQKFGHGKATCRRKATCAKCAQEGHLDTECTNSPHCVNCSGQHCAYSRDCPEWSKQKEITRVKYDSNVSFVEARKIVEQSMFSNVSVNGAPSSRRPGLLYSQAAVQNQIKNTKSVEIQTDYTWPLDKPTPILCSQATQTAPIEINSVPATAASAAQTDSVDSELGAVGGRTLSPSKIKTPMAPSKQNIRPDPRPKPGPASSAPKLKLSNSNRPSKGSGDVVKLSNRYSSLDEMELDLGGASSSSPNKRKNN